MKKSPLYINIIALGFFVVAPLAEIYAIQHPSSFKKACDFFMAKLNALRAYSAARELKGRVKSDAFVTVRNLTDYISNFKSPYIKKLESLNANSRWLVGGAGQVLVADGYYRTKVIDPKRNQNVITEEYLRYILARSKGASDVDALSLTPEAIENREGDLELPEGAVDLWNRIIARPLQERAQVTAVSYRVQRPNIPNFEGRLKILKDRWFEEISDEELGSFDLITDFYGITTYSTNPSEVINKYLRLLKSDGEIYIRTGSIFIESENNSITLEAWLGQFPGLEVLPLGPNTFRIVKRQDSVVLPNLKIIPNRWFETWNSLIPVSRFQVIK